MYHFVSVYLCLQWLAHIHFRIFMCLEMQNALWHRQHAPGEKCLTMHHTTHNIHTTTTWWNIWQETPRSQILSKSLLPFHGWGWGGGAFCSEPPLFSAKWLQYTVSILQISLCITHGDPWGNVFSRKWLGLQPRVNHFVDWCRSEDRPYFYDCVEKSSGQKLWLNLFLLDLVRFFSLIQTSIPIVPWKICVNIAFFSWSSFLLWNILEPFLWPEHTGTGKKIHLQKDCQHIVGKKNRKISMLQKLHEKKWIHLRKGGVKTTRG